MIVVSTEAEANVKLVRTAVEVVFNDHDIAAIDRFFSKASYSIALTCHPAAGTN